MSLTTLFRPVGSAEYALLEASGWREFPPRLPEQPIFYPVANEDYAIQIARDWNSNEGDRIGYVTAFDVEADFLKKYAKQQVGGRDHVEYWIPADDLAEFNRHIIGSIRIVRIFRSGIDATDSQ